MDVYGLNPKIKEGSVKPKEIDFGKATDQEKETYWDLENKYQKENTGVYFRANVWCWRPIWNYVYDTTDVLTDEDHRLGHENSYHKITADKAERIGKQLMANLNDAVAKEATYKKDVEPRRKFNKLCNEAGSYLYKNIVDKSDGLITCPGDMKIHDPANYKRWTALNTFGGVQFESTSYPFNANYIKEFANFCINSGGFEIG